MIPATKKPIVGTALLIAGSCIGAGMIGLPMASLAGGFLPSILMIFLAYLFTTLTGLLLLEATLQSPAGSNLLTIVAKRLGPLAKVLVALLFSALFYALFTAFFEGVAALLSGFCKAAFTFDLDRKLSLLFSFAAIFSATLTGTRGVDFINRGLVTGLFLGYLGLVMVGLPHVELQYLAISNYSAALGILPLLLICFGYHNLIPSLCTYLDRDPKALRKAIILGNMIPLGVYLLWNFVVLGLIDQKDRITLLEGGGEEAVLALLRAISDTPLLALFAALFTATALLSSFLPTALSFSHFLEDGLPLPLSKTSRHAFFTALALAPPLLFSLLVPGLFMAALHFAGGIVVVLLYGILPPLLVYFVRKQVKEEGFRVPGGNVLLSAVFIIALFIFSITLYSLK